MRARRHERSSELAAHNFYRLAHLRESALARKLPRSAPPSRSLVTFLSRFSVASAGHDLSGSRTVPVQRPALLFVTRLFEALRKAEGDGAGGSVRLGPARRALLDDVG